MSVTADANRPLTDAWAALAGGRPAVAARLAGDAAAAGMKGPGPHWLAAVALAASGSPGMAAVSAGRADGHAPGAARGELVRACVAAFGGADEKARRHAAAALAADPGCAAAHAVLAGLAAVAEDWDAADRHAAAGLAADPGHAACEELAALAGDPLTRDDPAACGAAVLAAFTPAAADFARGPAPAATPEPRRAPGDWADPHADATVRDAARELLGRWLPRRTVSA